ncbi:MAG TPA: ABC transporter permease, partial [Gammaproteobacteria bacterium]
MSVTDVFAFATASVAGYRVRSLLMLFAMAVGVASVVALTALGEGARRYVTGEFAALGTHLVIVLPGRSETTGGAPPLLGETPRDLTLDDALALERSRAVRRVAPVALGSAPVSFEGREREVITIGTTAAFLEVRRLKILAGRFLPSVDPHRAASVCVIG